ncbi:MAG: DNA polymerase III subunit delta [bacterium]
MIFLFHGKNNYLSFKEAKSLLEKIIEKRSKQDKSIETISIDASISPFEQIVNEVETPSFFNNHKVIFLKRPSENNEKEKMSNWILDMVKNKNQRKGIDIVIWENKKVRSNSKLIKEMGKNSWESPELKPRSFTRWARDEVKRKNINIENNALDLLSQRVNYEPERFHHELDKIKLLGKKKTTEKDIEKISPDTLEKSVWDFVDSLNSNKKGKSSELLNELLQQGNDPYYLLSMISRNIRILLLTKLLDEKGLDSSDIAKEIGTHPFVISKIKSKAKNMDIKRIKKIYEKLASIDYTTKTGQIDIELALNLLISVI